MANPTTIVQLKTIPSKDFTIGILLGKGGFGQVHLGKWGTTPIAVKELLVQVIDDQFLNIFKSEAKIMAQCNHRNIVQLYGICVEGKLALIMEYLENGSLDKFLKKAYELPWPRRYSIAADIGKGLAYLHDRNIIHRDLKSLNILIAKDNTAKITDFGLAKIHDQTKSHTNHIIGSPIWMAPEQLCTNTPASTKTDIYSMGMVLWEIATQKLPYSHAANVNMIYVWKLHNVPETIPPETPKTYAGLILQCWKAPTERPKAQNLAEDLVRLTRDPDQTPAATESTGHLYPSNWQHTLSALDPQPTSKSIRGSYLSNYANLSPPSSIPQNALSSNPTSSDLNNLSVESLRDQIYSLLDNEEVRKMNPLFNTLKSLAKKLSSASSIVDQDRQIYRSIQQLFDTNKKVCKDVAQTIIELSDVASSKPISAPMPNNNNASPPQPAVKKVANTALPLLLKDDDKTFSAPMPNNNNASPPQPAVKKVVNTSLPLLLKDDDKTFSAPMPNNNNASPPQPAVKKVANTALPLLLKDDDKTISLPPPPKIEPPVQQAAQKPATETVSTSNYAWTESREANSPMQTINYWETSVMNREDWEG